MAHELLGLLLHFSVEHMLGSIVQGTPPTLSQQQVHVSALSELSQRSEYCFLVCIAQLPVYSYNTFSAVFCISRNEDGSYHFVSWGKSQNPGMEGRKSPKERYIEKELGKDNQPSWWWVLEDCCRAWSHRLKHLLEDQGRFQRKQTYSQSEKWSKTHKLLPMNSRKNFQHYWGKYLRGQSNIDLKDLNLHTQKPASKPLFTKQMVKKWLEFAMQHKHWTEEERGLA